MGRQGITDEKEKLRAVPSAGATYPLEIYLVVGEVRDLEKGVYHYLPFSHQLELKLKGDYRKKLALASFHQTSIAKAAIDIWIAGDYQRTKKRYGQRGEYYVHLEVGHCAQNIFLQATALGLSGVPVGAFEEDSVKKIFNLQKNFTSFYILALGKK